MARFDMNMAVEVAQGLGTVVVGVAWANGLVADVPLLGAIPDIVHLWLGYITAVVGVVGVGQKLMK